MSNNYNPIFLSLQSAYIEVIKQLSSEEAKAWFNEKKSGIHEWVKLRYKRDRLTVKVSYVKLKSWLFCRDLEDFNLNNEKLSVQYEDLRSMLQQQYYYTIKNNKLQLEKLLEERARIEATRKRDEFEVYIADWLDIDAKSNNKLTTKPNLISDVNSNLELESNLKRLQELGDISEKIGNIGVSAKEVSQAFSRARSKDLANKKV